MFGYPPPPPPQKKKKKSGLPLGSPERFLARNNSYRVQSQYENNQCAIKLGLYLRIKSLLLWIYYYPIFRILLLMYSFSCIDFRFYTKKMCRCLYFEMTFSVLSRSISKITFLIFSSYKVF